MPTRNEAIIAQVYGGDPGDVVGVITATRHPTNPFRIAGVSHTYSVNETYRTNDEKLMDDFIGYGFDGKKWKLATLIGIPSALVLAGLAGWYFGGRKCRRR